MQHSREFQLVVDASLCTVDGRTYPVVARMLVVPRDEKLTDTDAARCRATSERRLKEADESVYTLHKGRDGADRLHIRVRRQSVVGRACVRFMTLCVHAVDAGPAHVDK